MSDGDRDIKRDVVVAFKAKAATQTLKVQVLYGSAIRKARDRRLFDAEALTREDMPTGEGLNETPNIMGK